MSRQIYPTVRVAIYSTVSAGSDRGRGEQPPVAEKEQQAGYAAKDDPAPRDFLLLHALCAEAAKGEEQHGEELRPEDIGEQPGGTLEAEQYPIDHADVDAPFPDGLVTEPINIDDYK